MVMCYLIQVEDAYELVFYSICNFICFYPKSTTATLYCLTCKCFLSVYNVYFILVFIFILILQMNFLHGLRSLTKFCRYMSKHFLFFCTD